MLRLFYKTTLLVLCPLFAFAQNFKGNSNFSPINISGIVIEQGTDYPLEYATIVLQNVRFPDRVTGGLTDENGKFSVEVYPGKYNLRVEFLSYRTISFNNQDYRNSTDLGILKLSPDVEQLENVEVVGERTTVELRLDKKVYNVGSDLTVQGGSVTDVLDNVPSVSVDVEGNISLRGNESVRILINGKPSALSGLSTNALQQLPSDAIEKVEVITNPSARYDAEGTAGILNIILKQSKTTGLNGSVNTYIGFPKRIGGNLSLNLRRDKFNIFTNTSYRTSNSPGRGQNLQQNFDNLGVLESYQNEFSNSDRIRNSFNTNVGFEYLFDKNTTLTQSFVVRKSDGDDISILDFENFDADKVPTINRTRLNSQIETDESWQYSINFIKKFKKDGHQLTADFQYSEGKEIQDGIIEEDVEGASYVLPDEQTFSKERQIDRLFQFDYVLPLGAKNQGQFELGYRGTFNDLNTDFVFGVLDENNQLQVDPNFSNNLLYKEYVNAAYTQLGSKFNKFSVLSGLRVENSNIDVNLLNTGELNEKKYTNWFPSLFLGYEFTETSQLSLSYSKRLRRPRSWFINPFVRRSSNTNLFTGNPDLDPTYTNSFDLGYLKRWDKFTLNSSVYMNRSTGVFQFITRETGDFVELENPTDPSNPVTVPVQLRSPINLGEETRMGFELTSTLTPKRGTRISWNLNLYQQTLDGEYTYTNNQNELVRQKFNADNFTWFTRLSGKFILPGKIDFQTNAFYRGRSINPQGVNKGNVSMNLAMSKEVIKDKATLSFNISDLFNSRKRISETKTERVFSESEFQWRQRQFTLNFLYRFNDPQNQRNRRGRNNYEMDEGEFEFQR